jgi:hypothetical protein
MLNPDQLEGKFGFVTLFDGRNAPMVDAAPC